ncbi:hypothetical protein H924_03945 [Corynebacterium callunae DSM 20147]|uniref:Uncharacterized protein n=1 Tax=Corynebacterium callunae DSM 20147 TaxID=1121353 RepID=M1UDZ6_9CORY|nr:hypothetical protein H924_03945 [Corynebacterium callunae DSM 20147]
MKSFLSLVAVEVSCRVRAEDMPCRKIRLHPKELTSDALLLKSGWVPRPCLQIFSYRMIRICGLKFLLLDRFSASDPRQGLAMSRKIWMKNCGALAKR